MVSKRASQNHKVVLLLTKAQIPSVAVVANGGFGLFVSLRSRSISILWNFVLRHKSDTTYFKFLSHYCYIILHSIPLMNYQLTQSTNVVVNSSHLYVTTVKILG